MKEYEAMLAGATGVVESGEVAKDVEAVGTGVGRVETAAPKPGGGDVGSGSLQPDLQETAPSRIGPRPAPIRGLGSQELAKGVLWAYEHMGEENPEGAPSAGAYAMWRWAREHPSNMSDFYLTVLPKVMPSKQQVEQDERYADDGRHITQLIEDVERASGGTALSDGSEDAGGESRIPTPDLTRRG